jgi:hypothetical protein
MDPRHTLYRTLETLTVDPENLGKMSAQDVATAPASSGVTPEGIEKKLKEGLGAVYVEIADLSGMYARRSAFSIMSFFCLLLLILVVSFSLIPVQQAPRDIGIGLVLCNFANGV